MKNIFLALFIIIGMLSCDKDRDQNSNILPEATQSGANTAGALVDGKIWVATKDHIKPPGTFCEILNNFTIVTLDLRQTKNLGSNSFFIKAKIENLELNKTYILNENDGSDFNFATYTNNSAIIYTTQSNHTGKIKITRLDLQNQIVSGFFDFQAIDINGNIVSITEGRFDKKFD